MSFDSKASNFKFSKFSKGSSTVEVIAFHNHSFTVFLNVGILFGPLYYKCPQNSLKHQKLGIQKKFHMDYKVWQIGVKKCDSSADYKFWEEWVTKYDRLWITKCDKIRVHTEPGKPGKPGKEVVFEILPGKPGKTLENW